MKFTCEKNTLINNINIVSKAVSSRTTLPILECILLNADPDGLKMTGNDLEMGIETSYIEAQIIEEGTIAIEAKLFSEIVKRLPDDGWVLIEVVENNMVVIKCGKAEFKILGLSGDEFPVIPYVEKNNEYSISGQLLRDMIRQTLFSVSVDESKPVLTGELFEIDDNSLRLVAVDGFRVSFRSAELEGDNANISVVVPGKTLNEISKILPADEESKISLYFTDKHMLIQMDECTIVSRLLDGEFLKYKQILETDSSTVVKIAREEFLKSLERASLISKETKKNPVKLEIERDIVKITSNTEMGTSYDELAVETEGEGLSIAFNPRYLIDALKVIDDDDAYMHFTTALSPCIIKGEEGCGYKYLILPLRVAR
ncbi:MAG: DNA polymerase III subunit beta [Defluviitaleaceae bacterium]|nr:DNA polymerase III subunit beta [Defluviitaleaceae bacterium]